jgi:patatin-related protein
VQTALEAPIQDPLLEELRLATVMTGGVSLAVWIGGVTAEFSRLLHQAPGYAELQRLLRTRCTLDVVSGTSAGGINGIMLAFAQARRADISVLRDVWLQEAALADILRSPREKDPLSLLQGDEKFLPALGAALRTLASTVRARAHEHPLNIAARERLQLFVTATLLQGESRSRTDDFGTVVHDVDHKALFRFSAKDLISDSKIPHLALAARTTASFPGAFEASYLEVDELNGHLDMHEHVDATISRFAVDGGVLVNKPLGPAIRAIFEATASQPVRRVLAYVVPDSGVSTFGETDRPNQPPPLQDVLMRSLLDIPHVQSVASDLDQITKHNDMVVAQREARGHLLELVGENLRAGEVNAKVFKDNRKLRAEAETGRLIDELTRQLNGLLARNRLPNEWKTALQFNPEAFAARRKSILGQLLERLPDPPGPHDDPTTDAYRRALATLGRTSLDRAAAVCLDFVRRSLELTTDASSELGLTLCRVAEELHRALEELSPTPEVRHVVRENVDKLPRLPSDITEPLEAWIGQTVVKSWQAHDSLSWRVPDEHPDEHPAVAWDRLVGPLTRHAEVFRSLTDNADATYKALAGFLLGRAGIVEPRQVIGRLLRLEAYERVMAVRALVTEQEAHFVQISADSRTLLNEDRRLASEKLTGLQLHHFGAFYKRSWRSNDWLWGRIDAAGWLMHLLLQPDRLRSLHKLQGGDPAECCARFLSEIKGVSRTGGGDVRAVVDEMWSAPARDSDGQTHEELVKAELLAALGPEPPASLPHTSMLAAAGVQIGILLEELPVLRQQLDLDAELGGGARKSAPFRAEYDHILRSEGVLDARRAVDLFRRCKVADEKLGDEFGTDLMTYTAATAAATGISAAGGLLGKAPAALKPGVALVRTGTLGVYALARMALQRSKTAFALLCLRSSRSAQWVLSTLTGHGVPRPR